MTDKYYMQITIDISQKAKISQLFHGATLEDSNKYYCEEVLISCEDIVKNTSNTN